MKTPLFFAILASSVMAGQAPPPVDHSLVLTETPSSTLAATYDLSPVGIGIINISTDHWGVTLPGGITISGNPQWTEPDDPSFFNRITSSGNNQLIVNSDLFSNGTVPKSNGSTFYNVGVDTRDNGSISVTFNDDGDVAPVPENGPTFVLAVVALAGIVGVRQFARVTAS